MVRLSNKKIIDELVKNGRISYVDLAKKFDVSETAIRKRISKLEENDIILGYTVEIDPKKLGYNVNALVGLDTEPEDYFSVIEKLKDFDEILKLYSSNGDHMLMIEAWFKDSNDLSGFVKKLNNISGVKRVCPANILERLI